MNSDSNTAPDTKAALPPLTTGQTLEHFRLEGLVGEGGMGTVYRSLSILNELSNEQTRSMLASSGVQFVREDVVQPGKLRLW
jgi:hypothetical protein